MRETLLAEGLLTESILTTADLLEADDIFLINSVREWVPVHFTL